MQLFPVFYVSHNALEVIFNLHIYVNYFVRVLKTNFCWVKTIVLVSIKSHMDDN